MITIKEIAKKADVSIGTVDRVIHNRGRVSKVNMDKIKSIIEEYGYEPNPHASTLSTRRIYKIAVVMPDLTREDGFWKIPEKGILKAVSELKSYKIKTDFFFYNRYSEHSFIETSEKLLKRIGSYQGFLLAPVLTEKSREFIRKIPEGLPLVLFDSPVPEADILAYIGHDSQQSGRLAGKLLSITTGGTGTLAVIRSSRDDFHINQRIRGFRDFLSVNGGPDSVKEFCLTEKSYPEILETVTEMSPPVRGVFVTDASAHVVAEYFQKHRIENISLVGYELTEENRKYTESGEIDFLINLRADEQGYRGIYSLFEHLILRKQVSPMIVTPIDILTAENISLF